MSPPSLSQLGHHHAQLQASPMTLSLNRQQSLEKCSVQPVQLYMEALRSVLSQLLRQTLVEKPLTRPLGHSSSGLFWAPSSTSKNALGTAKHISIQAHSLCTPGSFRKVKTGNSLTSDHRRLFM